MRPHPDRDNYLRRLVSRVADLVSGFDGSLFRFVDPRFSDTQDLFAGRGAFEASVRWHVKGKRLVTYTSLQAETALAETLAAQRYYGFPDENRTPIVLVTAAGKLKRVVDLRCGWIPNGPDHEPANLHVLAEFLLILVRVKEFNEYGFCKEGSQGYS